MAIYYGSTQITTIRYGGTTITSGYYGSYKVYAAYSTYTLTISKSSPVTVTVTRSSSPNAGASTGTILSGAGSVNIYTGDVISISATTSGSYYFDGQSTNNVQDKSESNITVSGNITRSYSTVQRKTYLARGTTGSISSGGYYYATGSVSVSNSKTTSPYTPGITVLLGTGSITSYSASSISWRIGYTSARTSVSGTVYYFVTVS